MEYKKILDEKPGRTIYAGRKLGEVYHSFTDTLFCPSTQKTLELPGKGAINHRISAFLFSKLNQLGVPTHFVKTVNMRESLMRESCSLPFDIKVHCQVGKDFAAAFGLTEGKTFFPPLIEYKTPYPYAFNDDFLLAIECIDDDHIDEVRGLVAHVTHLLQGFFMGMQLALIDLQLNLAYSPEGEFIIAGQLSPELFCVRDLQTGDYLGGSALLEEKPFSIAPYRVLAHRLGLLLEASSPLVSPLERPFLCLVP